MPKNFKPLIWIVVALAAGVALLLPRLRDEGDGAAAESAAEPEPLAVEVRVVEPGRLVERFATVGTLRADEWVEIRSEISGVLASIDFEEGSRVEAGALLARLDDAELAAERDRAFHRVELARLREARQQDLVAQGLTSQEDYDLAFSQLNVLEAELRLARTQLDKTEIHAPFAGLIGLRRVSRGATVGRETPIATLRRIDPIKVEFSVPESYAARIRPGETVSFRVKGSDALRRATIYALEPSIDQETRSLLARARAANPGGALLPGAFADVELPVREIDDALTVPAMAVIPELGGKKVFVVEEGRAMPRLVETGVRTDVEVQVTRGLEPGDRVIVSAIQRLAAGLPVREQAARQTPEREPSAP